MSYEYAFRFSLGARELEGALCLEDAEGDGLAFRSGFLEVAGGGSLEISLTHSAATETFIYLSEMGGSATLKRFLDTRGIEFPRLLPGQFLLGAERTRIVMEGVADCLRSPVFERLFTRYGEGEIALFPVLREGMKYGLGEAALSVGGRFCDEIVVDAHHVADAAVPGLGRRMELSAFKDADLNDVERERVKVAVIGDSVASGTVIIGLVEALAARFPKLERVELVAPLGAVYGLARIAAFTKVEVPVRIHCFETLLNALAPDYYYSPHFNEPAMHISPEAEARYREWWGQDSTGRWIADTACSGYGWSEAFFNPGKQLRMIEEELGIRNGMGLKELLSRR